MRDDFKTAAAFLLPTCPVQKKHLKKNGPNAEIASLNPNAKGGRGSTGVVLCWWPRKECLKLPKELQKELSEWTATQPPGLLNKKTPKRGNSDKGGMSNKKMKRTASCLVTKQLAKMADKKGVTFEVDEFDGMAKSFPGLVSSMMVDAKKKADVGSTAATPDPDAAEMTDVSGLVGSLRKIMSRKCAAGRKKTNTP